MGGIWGPEEMKSWNFWKSLIAEFMGTAFLVLYTCGSTTGNEDDDRPPIQIAFASGLIHGIMVQNIGHISGGHINPAVTVGMLVMGNISIIRGAFYMLSQFLGAIVGALILYQVLPDDERGMLGVPELSQISHLQGMGIEFLTTFVIVLTVLSTTDPARPEQKKFAPMLIGLSVAACSLWAILYTGAGLNTARCFAPALIMNLWLEEHWVYWVGPLAGGLVAGILYKLVFAQKSHEEDESHGENAWWSKLFSKKGT